MRVRHGLVAICATVAIILTAGVPAIAEDVVEDTGTSDPIEAPSDPIEAPSDSIEAPSDSTPPPSDSTPPPDHLVVQDIEIESIQVAVSNTGDNVSTSDALPAPSSGTPATELDTGSASAVGSSDATAIGQRVVTDLQDEATADIVQVSIVFNIGGATADSGANVLASGIGGTGSGTIATGSATAVGNSADTYVTQGASGQAAPGEIDEVHQHSTTLQIGLSVANSGGNVVSATLATVGPATARTGDATAIGNLSSTAIDQVVEASGRGTAALHIEQRATVVNLGIAFAGTGANTVGSDFAAALASGDDDALERLLELILPALAASTGSAAGAGEISTGDATAIGNRSNTRVLQVAVGEADSGSVSIRQDVMVVNVGAASATTGSNSIGGRIDDPRAALAPGAHDVISQLSSFVRSLLSDVNSWAAGTNSGSGLGSRALETAFGDFIIGIDRSIAATANSPTVGAVSTRQVAAVINLAVARANSGRNSTSVMAAESDLAAVLAEPAVAQVLDATGTAAVLVMGNDRPLLIVTGDASAANSSVLVLCQRADLLELDCLGPPEVTTEPPAPPTDTPPADQAEPPGVDDVGPGATLAPAVRPAPPAPSVAATALDPAPQASPPSLPATGTDSGRLLHAALVLLLFGSILVVVSRRALR